MVKLLEAGMDDSGLVRYEPTIAGSADEITPLLIQGELDIAAVPSNLAAVLYNRTEGQIQMLAANTLGVLYILEYGGEEIQSFADLAGHTIYATGKGSTPEYFLRYLLTENGLDPDADVTLEWKRRAGGDRGLAGDRGSGGSYAAPALRNGGHEHRGRGAAPGAVPVGRLGRAG